MDTMRSVVCTLLALVFFAAVAIVWGYFATPAASAADFLPSILVNLGVEIFGVVVGLAVAGWVAIAVAQARLLVAAPRLLALIAQLRRDKILTPEAARAAVACAVTFLSEGSVAKLRQSSSVHLRDIACDICGQETEIPSDDPAQSCSTCGLPGSCWKY